MLNSPNAESPANVGSTSLLKSGVLQNLTFVYSPVRQFSGAKTLLGSRNRSRGVCEVVWRGDQCYNGQGLYGDMGSEWCT